MAGVKRTEGAVSGESGVPVSPAENQYNRYNMTLPQSFSVYNDEGSVIYRGEVEQIANKLRAEIFGEEKAVKAEEPKPGETEKPKKAKKEKKSKVCVKKRAFFFVIPLILAVAIIAVAVMGIFDLSFAKYLSIYNYKHTAERSFAMLDPVLSFISTKFGISFGDTITAEFFNVYTISTGEFLPAFIGYALPISIALYVVFALVTVIVSIAGLAGKKREDGTYARAKLGFLSIVMFGCALIATFAGMYVAGCGMNSFVNFISGKGEFFAGYVLYAMVAVPVITFICTCVAYKKEKKAE